jgi:hypothetical protein
MVSFTLIFFLFLVNLNILFFLEEFDSVTLYFSFKGYIEEIKEENPEMEQIVEEHGGLTLDDWFVWMGISVEEEAVIRSNFTIIRLFVYFLICLAFFRLVSSLFSSLFKFFSFFFCFLFLVFSFSFL